MTTSEFFIILGTIYIAPSMSQSSRKLFGIFFIVAAVIVEIAT